MSDKKAKKVPVLASIALGGCAAVFTVNFTHPIELMKTRLQVYGTVSPLSMIKQEGILGFWKGIQPAWGRESFYASIKIGGYGPIREAIGAGDKGLYLLPDEYMHTSFRFVTLILSQYIQSISHHPLQTPRFSSNLLPGLFPVQLVLPWAILST